MTDHTPLPDAPIIESGVNRRIASRPVAWVSIRCPYCSKTHQHGTPDDELGTRIAHCGRGSYRITAQ